LIHRKLTDDQINEVIKYWRNKLALRDWIISWSMHNDADLGDAYARVGWSLSYMSAHIRISDPDTWSVNADETDMEESIVHEMIHIRTAEICDKLRPKLTEEENLCFLERPTDVISKSFVELRRMGHQFDWEVPEGQSVGKKKRKKKS
jgi:hypothetical protein